MTDQTTGTAAGGGTAASPVPAINMTEAHRKVLAKAGRDYAAAKAKAEAAFDKAVKPHSARLAKAVQDAEAKYDAAVAEIVRRLNAGAAK